MNSSDNSRRPRSRPGEPRKISSSGEANGARRSLVCGYRPMLIPTPPMPTSSRNASAKKLSEADDFLLRIRGIDRDTKIYCDDLRALLTRAAPDLIDQPVEDAAAALNSRLLKARQLQQEREHLEKRLLEEDNRLRAAVDALSQAETRLELLCAEAGCSKPAELLAAETRSQRRRQRENAIKQLERVILAESAGQSLQAFLAEVDGENHDARATRLQQLKGEHLAADQRLGELRETIGAEQKTLETLGSRAPSADAAERIESLLAVLRDDVEQYACLKLADVLLRRGLERYRERNRNPIVERASELFAQLSAGSFAGLRPDFDEDGKEVLKGIRAGSAAGARRRSHEFGHARSALSGDSHRQPGSMAGEARADSFGARRSLAQFRRRARRAALQVLASLSRKTQVLFFTHHAHLVELAHAAVPGGQLFVHELPGRHRRTGKAACPTSPPPTPTASDRQPGPLPRLDRRRAAPPGRR